MAEIADRKPGEEDRPLSSILKEQLTDVLKDINENFHETGERQIIKNNLRAALDMWDRLEAI